MAESAGDYSQATVGTAFLAIASGSADVIAFLTLGHVFASAMTGNTALFGIALSEGDMKAASQPIVAMFGFVAGAALAAALDNPNRQAAAETMLRRLLCLEIACLVAFAGLWQISGSPAEGAGLYALILLCSIAMGIQGIAAKRIKAPGVNTIVFTSTLVSIVWAITELALRRTTSLALRQATRQQIAVFGAYGLGAITAGLLAWSEFALLVWLPAVAVALALILYSRR